MCKVEAPCGYPASYPSLAGRHLEISEGKKGEGGASKAGLPPCGLTRGTTSLPVPAAPRASLRASSLLALGMACPLLPHPSVKAQGGTPASMRAPCSPMLSTAVPRSLGGMPPFSASSVFLCPKLGVVAGVCLASHLPLLSLPPSRGQPGQRAGGACGHLGKKIEGHRPQRSARTWGLNHAHLGLQGDGGTG